MLKNDLIATFSIIAYDPQENEWGVAVASKYLAVGSMVPWAKAGVGAVATQSWGNPSFGPEGLKLLEAGKSPEEVIKILTAADPGRELRQLAVINKNGKTAVFTGSECSEWAGSIEAKNYSVQGNILTGEKVVKAVSDKFKKTEARLAERLTTALAAGQKAGGDQRGRQAAALFVVKEGAGINGLDDRYIDLRVDDHPEPIKELRRLLNLFYKMKADQ
jgi:uncharacterized Ntn-hydrolase superfamily protein